MIGPEGVAQLLATRLAEAVPARLTDLELRLDLPANSLPRPSLVLPRDTFDLALNDYPALLVIPQEVRSMARSDVGDDGGETFRVRYAVRVYIWARGEHEQDADLCRKRLTLAAREVLLDRSLLGPDGAIDPTTLIESYSDIAVDEKLAATVAASYLGVDLVFEEDLAGPGPNYRADIIHPAYDLAFDVPLS